jgi:type II secretory pathway predicted ATPase ExeA
LTEAIAHSSPGQALDPASFVVRARSELLGQLVERVLQGERFLALSGAPGTGKSVMARAIHDELLSRSVTALRIERGEVDGIGSRSIICQLLHKPEAEFQPDDVETLFDTLAIGGDDGQRRAIIIDDADLLRPDALQYLRLVSNMVPEQMPPVVFVGRSSFWDVPEQPGSSDAHSLITCRLELEHLSDAEAHAFIRQTVPDTAAHLWLNDEAREALVRHADGSIGRLAALLTAARDTPGVTDESGTGQTVTNREHARRPALTIDEPAPFAAYGSAVTILPSSHIALNSVADAPPVEHARESARWPVVVRHLTAAALMLAVVGGVAYWQLTVHAGQIERAADSATLTAAVSSGVGAAALPLQETPSSSNAAIDENVPAEPPPRASPPAAGPSSDPSGPSPPSIEPTLTTPVFRVVTTNDADQPFSALIAEFSVALSDDPDAVWLASDSVSAEQLFSLASVPAEQPPQSPAIGPPAAGTEPAIPQVQTAAVPEKPSEDIPSPTTTAIPPAAADDALAAAPAAPDPGRPERNAETAPIVVPEPPNASTPLAQHEPPPAAEPVASSPTVPAIPQPLPEIAVSPTVPPAPSGSPLAATPTPARTDQELSRPPVAPSTPVPPQQSALAPSPPVGTPDEVSATSPPASAAATAPVAPSTPVPPQQSALAPSPPVGTPDEVSATSPPASAAATAPAAPSTPVPPQQSATAPLPPDDTPDEAPATSLPTSAAATAPVAPPAPVPPQQSATAPLSPVGTPHEVPATLPPASAAATAPIAPPAPVPPQQSETAALPSLATPDKVPATSPQAPAATTPVAPPPPTSAASVDIATPQAPVPPPASVGNSAALLRAPEPPKPPPAAPPVAPAPQLDLGLLLSRGDAMLALGDLSAARRFYERAATLGSARAATALGNTYDAAFLASIQAKGIVADEVAAITWYRKAAALGDTEAARQLKRLAPAQ